MIDGTRVFRIAPRRNRKWQYIALLLLATPVIMMAAASYHFELVKDRMMWVPVILALVMVPLALWIDHRFAESARLTVDRAGIRLASDLPRFTGRYAGWDVRWEEINRVSLIERMGMVQIRQRGFTAPAPRMLRIADWIEEGAPAPEKPAKPRASPLFKLLDEAGFFKAYLSHPSADALNFDLALHPATRTALIVMAVLAAYWAIDGFIANEAWAEWSAKYIVPHAVVGLIGAGVAAFALKAARDPGPVPSHVLAPLAVLIGLTTALASWTGLIRVNQLAGGPLVEKAYVRNDSCDTLMPLDKELPPIEYTEQAKHYWCQFPKATQHIVPIRRGVGGLYQVDLSRHTAAIREYRARQGR